MTRKAWIDRELRRQMAIPGTRLTQRDKLQRLSDRPLAAAQRQKPAAGMFDTDARNQIDLVELCKGTAS